MAIVLNIDNISIIPFLSEWKHLRKHFWTQKFIEKWEFSPCGNVMFFTVNPLLCQTSTSTYRFGFGGAFSYLTVFLQARSAIVEPENQRIKIEHMKTDRNCLPILQADVSAICSKRSVVWAEYKYL